MAASVPGRRWSPRAPGRRWVRRRPGWRSAIRWWLSLTRFPLGLLVGVVGDGGNTQATEAADQEGTGRDPHDRQHREPGLAPGMVWRQRDGSRWWRAASAHERVDLRVRVDPRATVAVSLGAGAPRTGVSLIRQLPGGPAFLLRLSPLQLR